MADMVSDEKLTKNLIVALWMWSRMFFLCLWLPFIFLWYFLRVIFLIILSFMEIFIPVIWYLYQLRKFSVKYVFKLCFPLPSPSETLLIFIIDLYTVSPMSLMFLSVFCILAFICILMHIFFLIYCPLIPSSTLIIFISLKLLY